MNVIVNTLNTHYEKAGKGPAVLLVHGWGETLKSYSALQKALSKNYTVIGLDLPGFGASDAPSVPGDLDDYADFIADFLAKIGVYELYAIIGHSNGGAIAIRGTALEKLKPKKLVLLAPSGIRSKGTVKKGIVKAVAKIGKVATLPLPKKAKNKLRAKFYKTVKSDALVAEHLKETFKKVVEQDVRDDAKKLDLPVLLLYGNNDVDTPPVFGQIFYKLIVGSELKIVKDATHYLHIDQPEVVTSSIQRFLKDGSV